VTGGTVGGITGGTTGGTIGASVTASTFAALFLVAVFFAGAFFAGFSSPAGFATGGNFSRNFLTTGGSTVEDAERTNSPISWSFARTSLLSIPQSFANS
jgi:hypothetical protein